MLPALVIVPRQKTSFMLIDSETKQAAGVSAGVVVSISVRTLC
jgi:hypothetical protein